MTEADWLACPDARPMLISLKGKSSERKYRLFACACCRRIWPHLNAKESRKVVEVSEAYADGRATARQLRSACEKANGVFQEIWSAGRDDVEWLPAQAVIGLDADLALDVWETLELAAAARVALAWREAQEGLSRTPETKRAARRAEEAVRKAAEVAEARTQADLLRDIMGNPFRPVTVDPSWLSETTNPVLGVAEACYAERAFDRLPVLADLLEEAGCTNAEILAHLRGPGLHVRGCWAVDLLLAKE